jgi:hypothetical protein
MQNTSFFDTPAHFHYITKTMMQKVADASNEKNQESGSASSIAKRTLAKAAQTSKQMTSAVARGSVDAAEAVSHNKSRNSFGSSADANKHSLPMEHHPTAGDDENDANPSLTKEATPVVASLEEQSVKRNVSAHHTWSEKAKKVTSAVAKGTKEAAEAIGRTSKETVEKVSSSINNARSSSQSDGYQRSIGTKDIEETSSQNPSSNPTLVDTFKNECAGQSHDTVPSSFRTSKAKIKVTKAVAQGTKVATEAIVRTGQKMTRRTASNDHGRANSSQYDEIQKDLGQKETRKMDSFSPPPSELLSELTTMNTGDILATSDFNVAVWTTDAFVFLIFAISISVYPTFQNWSDILENKLIPPSVLGPWLMIAFAIGQASGRHNSHFLLSSLFAEKQKELKDLRKPDEGKMYDELQQVSVPTITVSETPRKLSSFQNGAAVKVFSALSSKASKVSLPWQAKADPRQDIVQTDETLISLCRSTASFVYDEPSILHHLPNWRIQHHKVPLPNLNRISYQNSAWGPLAVQQQIH